MSDIGVDTLANRMRNVIALYNGELSNAEVIGALEILKMELYAEIEDDEDVPKP